MKTARDIIICVLFLAISNIQLSAQTNRRRRPTAPPVARQKPVPVSAADARLTGLYRLNVASSDDPRAAAERATVNESFALEQEEVEDLTARLTSPDQLSLERRGQTISIASTRAPRITFSADGRERIERATDGRTLRTRADLIGDQLTVKSGSGPDNQFNVTFVPEDEGRRLRVIRSITIERTDGPVVVQSVYDRVSTTARFDIYGLPETARASRNTRRPPPPRRNQDNETQQPPVNDRLPFPTPVEDERREADVYALLIPSGMQFVATLDDDLTTAQTREGDPFTMTVRAPAQYEGATIEGTVARVAAGGRISGRSEIALDFRQIRLRDGRTAGFDGTIESVRATSGERVRVDTGEGSIQEGDSRGNTAAQRAAIGAAIGAVIGAISDGGKGAAIGAAIGAGAGAGSVYIQGRDDLELRRGTELAIRTGPRSRR